MLAAMSLACAMPIRRWTSIRRVSLWRTIWPDPETGMRTACSSGNMQSPTIGAARVSTLAYLPLDSRMASETSFIVPAGRCKIGDVFWENAIASAPP